MFKNTEGFLCTLICRRNLWVRGKSYVSIVHSHALSLTGLYSVVVTLGGAIWPLPVSRPIEAEALPRHCVMGRREYWLARGTWQPGVPLKHKQGQSSRNSKKRRDLLISSSLCFLHCSVAR